MDTSRDLSDIHISDQVHSAQGLSRLVRTWRLLSQLLTRIEDLLSDMMTPMTLDRELPDMFNCFLLHGVS